MCFFAQVEVPNVSSEGVCCNQSFPWLQLQKNMSIEECVLLYWLHRSKRKQIEQESREEMRTCHKYADTCRHVQLKSRHIGKLCVFSANELKQVGSACFIVATGCSNYKTEWADCSVGLRYISQVMLQVSVSFLCRCLDHGSALRHFHLGSHWIHSSCIAFSMEDWFELRNLKKRLSLPWTESLSPWKCSFV